MASDRTLQLQRLGLLVGVALVGLASALIFNWKGLQYSLAYTIVASGLLCFGLFMAMLGIDRNEALQHWRTVVIAITFGVLCKYLLIFGAAYATTQNWVYSVMGMTVAQIDPLSVAALSNDQRLSSRARTILNLWASFDDPMTALATPLLLGLAAHMAHQDLAAGASWGDVLINLTPFSLTLIVVAGFALRRRLKPTRPIQLLRRIDDSGDRPQTGGAVATLAVAAPTRLYSLAALAGLVFRPAWLQNERRAQMLLNVALYGATFLLGILLAGGVDWIGGLTLGVATYASQVVVAWLVAWLSARVVAGPRLSSRDTWHLALGQQNGITAIVLALNLEPIISGAVAVISLAILVVNIIHFVVNSLFDRYELHREA